MKTNILKLLKLFLIIFVFSLFLYNSFNYLDPDFGWHLKAGEEVFKTKQVPWNENYNYSLEGRNWVDHEWLLNTICYFIYIKIGYFYINILFALTGTLIFVLLNFYFIKKYIQDNLHFLFIFFVQLIALIGILPHSGVRMQEFSVLFFLLELILIDKFQTTNNTKWLIGLPPLFLIWANIHGGFMLGLVVLWFYLSIAVLAPKIINYLKLNYFEISIFNKKTLILLFCTSVLSSLSTLITPYGYKYFSFMFTYTNTYYLMHISEWLPAYFAPIIYSQQLYYIIFIIIIIFLLKNTKHNKINLWYFLLGLLLFVSAFKSRRNFPLFFIASLPLITIYTNYFNKRNFNKIYPLIFSKYLKINSILVLFLCIILLLLSTNFTNTPFENKKFCTSFPCAALKTIKSLPQKNLKIFNDYGSGGYLVWNWPNNKIFIDGRLPMLTVNNHSFLEEYYDFFDKEKIAEKLNMYNNNLILGKKFKIEKYNWFEKTFLGFKDDYSNKNPIEEYLKSIKEWNLIFEDDNFFVYSKS